MFVVAPSTPREVGADGEDPASPPAESAPPSPPAADASSGAELARQQQRAQLLLLRNIVPLLVGYVTETAEVGRDEHGRWHGTGTVLLRRGQRYEGRFEHGLLEGCGTLTWPDGTQYSGELRRSALRGRGTYRWPNRCQYSGQVCCGRRHGYGVFSHPSGYGYLGAWDHGAKHGQGKMFFGSEKNSVYEGEWKNNQREGYGERIYPSGNNYSGYWSGGRREGHGTMRWYRWAFYLEIYEGEWKNGLQHGQGRHEWQTHQLDPVQHPRFNTYTGSFRGGERHGSGVFHYSSDATFTGRWAHNLKQGTGHYVDVVQTTTTQDFIDDKVMYVCETSEETGTTMCVYSDLRDFEHLLKPTYQLDMSPLLAGLPEPQRAAVADQVWTVLRRHISELRRIYSYYSRLGTADLQAATYAAMTQLQWWQMMRDCDVHVSGLPADVLMGIPMLACGTGHPLAVVHFHEYLLMFLLLADVLYTTEEDWQLAERVGRFIEQVVLVRDARTVTGLVLTLPLSRRPRPALLEQLYDDFQQQQPATVRSAVRRLGTGRVPQFPAVRASLILRAARRVVPLMVVEDQLDTELELTFIDYCELLLQARQLHWEQPAARAGRPRRARQYRRPARPIYERYVPTYALLQYRQRLLAALRDLAAPPPRRPAAGKGAKHADKKSSTGTQLQKDRNRVSSVRVRKL
ncbi:Radial spoke head 10 B [Amphibalanus amphitrite]|uniref:Radial spoke head 10 B n=1 Tax=Amphibalanus amphitrite TaxID=1232801 RepID=A0A6A4X204_AMPAM|nr:Radial spoke head 10 B [Amphibalanus amphitrite]